MIAAFLAAFVPDAQRARLNAGPLATARWSFVLGIVGGAIGLLLYMNGALNYLGPTGGDLGLALLESGLPIEETHLRSTGLIAWFAWHLNPLAWLSMYLAFTGLARVIAFLATREPVPEPILLLFFAVKGGIRGRVDDAAVRSRFGPIRPDRALVDTDGSVVLLTCREHPGWDQDTTIKLGHRFFHPGPERTRKEADFEWFAYALTELDATDPPTDLIRTSARLPADMPDPVCRPAEGRWFYFAYGKLMDDLQMAAVAPSARMLAVAKSKAHRLALDRPAGDGCSRPTAVASPTPADAVWGVVWDCELADEGRLAEAERIGTAGDWQDTEVESRDGNTYAVRLCATDAGDLDPTLSPPHDELRRLLDAAQPHGLPHDYRAPLIAFLKLAPRRPPGAA